MSETAPASTLDPIVARDTIEHVFEQGWTDGLPALAATDELVEEFLAQTPRDPDAVVAWIPQLKKEATVRHVAVSAVMAGCKPEYFTLVLATWDALMRERPVLGGVWQTTSGPAPLTIVNGGIRERLGINSAGNVLGPGFRANATVTRAIGLTVSNVFGVRPHVLDQATQGVPGRWSQLIGECEEESPWEPLSVELGLAKGQDAVSTILVRTTEYLDNRYFDNAEQVLDDFADTIRRTGPWIMKHQAVGLVLNPEHAWLFADAGYSKQGVRDYLYERTYRTEAELRAVGKTYFVAEEGVTRPDDYRHHVTADATAASFPIVVAGSRNAAISAVFRVFTTWSAGTVAV